LLASASVVEHGSGLIAKHGGCWMAREPDGLVQVSCHAGAARLPELLLGDLHRRTFPRALRAPDELPRRLELPEPRLVLREECEHVIGGRARAQLRRPGERNDRKDI
jgi:hypothetical protein